MPLFALYDETNTLLNIRDFSEKPADPLGKRWYWAEYTPPPPPIEAVKAIRLTEIKDYYTGLLRDGLLYKAKIAQIDQASQINIIGAAVHAVVLGQSFQGIEWRMSDNSFIKLATAPDVIEFAQTVAAYVESIRKIMWTHIDAINALDDRDAINSYDITTGWK